MEERLQCRISYLKNISIALNETQIGIDKIMSKRKREKLVLYEEAYSSVFEVSFDLACDRIKPSGKCSESSKNSTSSVSSFFYNSLFYFKTASRWS